MQKRPSARHASPGDWWKNEGGRYEVHLLGFGGTEEVEVKEGSDIDLAVWGCPEIQLFDFLGRLIQKLEHPR
jgi:hypothetical protein